MQRLRSLESASQMTNKTESQETKKGRPFSQKRPGKNKYQNRIEQMYEDYLDGRITKDFYDKKQEKYRLNQEQINLKMKKLQNADEEYYVTASYILSLANRAYDLFLSSEPEIKRQLLTLVLQNCEIKDASLRYTLNYPFSAIFNYTKSHNWLLG